ncbi:MAG TPA: FmdB family zinc ribbon protein [Actinomycetota bacterium]|nr:FmdB family zinc ribbon protein [Actinomycetota bacterium]
MPTYEYACQSCGSHIEVYQRFSDEPLRDCGVCGGPLRKVFHPAGILFKGSGFYATDSRAAAKSGGGEGSSGDGAGDTPKTGSKEKSKDTAASGGSKETPASASSGGSKEKSA